MQGKKDYGERLFVSFQLSEHVPEDNLYRRLRGLLKLDFLYERTRAYYGDCGQKSLDPVVFFKICLVGYLENIISDRKLVDHCRMRLDIMFFLGYNIDEELPWHSTISRTRSLFSDEVFDEVFSEVFTLCVEAGLVSGHSQTIDSAPVKANASMESLELKVPEEDLDIHLRKVRYMSSPDRKAKNDKATDDQKKLSATKGEQNELVSRNKRWKETQDQRPGAKNKNAKYTSNKTHYSPTDPDSRVSVKPGKARKLNYTSQMAVDISHHVITDIGADYADRKDNQSLEDITIRLRKRLNENGLIWRNVIADTGYSSGENYAFLEREGLVSYIPPHGTYKGGPEDLIYLEEENSWICQSGQLLTFRGTRLNPKGIKENHYATSRRDCKDCPIAEECKGKNAERRIRVTYYREEYERAIKRIKSKRGRRMKGIRQSTVEPVFGTLTQFMGLRKINTRGISNANKVMLMAGTAYNLKKLLKYTTKSAETQVQEQRNMGAWLNEALRLISSPIAESKWSLSWE